MKISVAVTTSSRRVWVGNDPEESEMVSLAIESVLPTGHSIKIEMTPAQAKRTAAMLSDAATRTTPQGTE